MKKYNINRKYSLEIRGGGRFEILDIGVAEDTRNPIEILKELDEICKEYVKQFEKPPFPDKTEDYIASKKHDPSFQEGNDEAQEVKKEK